MDKRAELRDKALKDLQQSGVLMLDGHFDYGNGYHGRVYLNPHQLFRHPSTIWRFAQDLIDLLPAEWDGVKLRHAIEPRHDSFRDETFFALCRDRDVAGHRPRARARERDPHPCRRHLGTEPRPEGSDTRAA